MRNYVLLTTILLSAAVNVFGDICPNPELVVSGIQGGAQAPCLGAIDFVSASYSTSQGTLHVVKYLDTSSPTLMLDCSSGKAIMSVTLTYPNQQPDGRYSPIAIKFKNVKVASVAESVNPTNETVDFNYAGWEIDSGNGSKTTANVQGAARPSNLMVAVVGSDGTSEPASHFDMIVRPGGVSTTSLQMASRPTLRPGGMRAGMMKTTVATAQQPHLNNGFIELRSPTGAVLSRYQFTGGVLLNGNLRVNRVNVAPTAAAIRVR